jgi:phosphoribosylglycinamide formyltransferase 1
MNARIAVLASGGGSNLQALLDYFARLGDNAPGSVVLVASDKADALALERARRRDIEALVLDANARRDLATILAERQITHVVLAGYMRLVPESVTKAFRGRIVNVHPALLPSFGGKGMYGHHVHEAVVASGARVSGATVHFVDEVYDHGATIAQWPIPVFAGDTPATVAVRVLEIEHQLYPRVVAELAAGRITLDATGRVRTPHDLIAFPHFVGSDEAGAADAWPLPHEH